MNASQALYSAIIRRLSQRLVAAQSPLHLLDAIRWDDNIRQRFLARHCQQQPNVDCDYYSHNALLFDPASKTAELDQITVDAQNQLGMDDPLTAWITRQCTEYQLLVRLLQARGRSDFAVISRELYGAASDTPAGKKTSTAALAEQLLPVVRNALHHNATEIDNKRFSAQDAAAQLQHRLEPVFGAGKIRMLVSDTLIADAAAGPDYIKLRAAAKYSDRDIGVLEVHEGWVHIGTSVSATAQPLCTFLRKTAPSASSTQEGLAVLTEILAGKSSPARFYKLLQRAYAIYLVEQGASFIDVYRFFTERGDSPDSIYQLCMRVFRGSTPTGGAFTKDLGYLRGLVQVATFVRNCVQENDRATLRLLFCGKCSLGDIALIKQLAARGVVSEPAFVAPVFTDFAALVQPINRLQITPGLPLADFLYCF